MLKTSFVAVAGGFASVPFSPSLACLAVVVAAAALIAHERREARGF
ncbi:hypothetical protein GALL_528410 [mine drainage metagenome]|uniref:Uncharacterized protein n=1 Tax=mine drainage metagenome TaxID=410659 RepID=A0A1J5PCQ3_9ZZZZ